jgi:hypothetical protein
VRIRCCGAGADLNWGTKGLNAREVSGGGFGRSDGDLSGGDTAVGDLPEESYLGRSPLVPVAGGPGPEDVFNHARVPPVPRFWGPGRQAYLSLQPDSRLEYSRGA